MSLFHAVVLDAEHLPTIQRISYSYTLGSAAVAATEAVAAVTRLEYTDMEPKVTESAAYISSTEKLVNLGC